MFTSWTLPEKLSSCGELGLGFGASAEKNVSRTKKCVISMFELKGDRLIKRDTEICLPFLSLCFIIITVLYKLGMVDLKFGRSMYKYFFQVSL